MSTTTTTQTQLERVNHDQGPVHPVMGDPMRFIMTAEQTAGRYALSEITVAPGNGAPPHIHHNEEEAMYVLEGVVEWVVDGTSHQLNAGDFLHIPRGCVRSFTNISDKPSRGLILHSPGAAADFYIAMGKLPPAPPLEDIHSLGKQFGIEVVTPK